MKIRNVNLELTEQDVVDLVSLLDQLDYYMEKANTDENSSRMNLKNEIQEKLGDTKRIRHVYFNSDDIPF